MLPDSPKSSGNKSNQRSRIAGIFYLPLSYMLPQSINLKVSMSVSNFKIYLLFLALPLTSCDKNTRQFTLVPASESGLHFRNDLTETHHNNIMTYEYSYNGGGVATGDLNADSLADIYFSGNTAPNKLFINKGNLKFEDITAASKTAGRNDWKTGVTMADVNADGWLDIYACYSGNAPEEGYEKPVIRDHP